MDYENKNKDAISNIKQALRQLATNGVPVGNMIKAINDIEEKYAESEDERIRKWLICTLKSLNNSPVQIDGAYEMMLPAIAWLEKQGEQKPADKVEPKFHKGDIIRHKKQGFTCKIIDVDTEYRLSGCNGTHLPFDAQDAYELVVQKPAWSEEDELIRMAFINLVEMYYGDCVDKQEKNKMLDWLKSLKERYTWKPSDEQIIAVNTAINVLGKGTINGKYLIELQEQLKEL